MVGQETLHDVGKGGEAAGGRVQHAGLGKLEGRKNGFGIGILIIGANLYGGVYKLRILMRENLEEILKKIIGFSCVFCCQMRIKVCVYVCVCVCFVCFQRTDRVNNQNTDCMHAWAFGEGSPRHVP